MSIQSFENSFQNFDIWAIFRLGNNIYIPNLEECEPNVCKVRTQSQAREEAREWLMVRDAVMDDMWNNR